MMKAEKSHKTVERKAQGLESHMGRKAGKKKDQ